MIILALRTGRRLHYRKPMRTVSQDLRYGIRVLLKSPGLTALAIVSLAVGIGANTAIFSVVNAILLHPVSYPDPDRLVFVWEQKLKDPLSQFSAAPPDFLDWRKQNRVFEDMTAVLFGQSNLTGIAEPERVRSNWVSASFFGVLGVQPALGRGFLPEEEAAGSTSRVAVLSYGLWQRRFGGSPTLVGIVGAVKQGPMEEQSSASVYVALWQTTAVDLSAADMMLSVRSALEPRSLSRAVINAIHTADRDLPVSKIQTMEDVVSESVWRPRFAAQLLGVFAGVALMLAVIGTYGIMAYSVTQRTQEIGIRMALGARRSDMMGLVLRQGLTLTAMGIAAGLAGAFALTRLLATLLYDVKAADPATFIGASAILALVAMLAVYVPARRAMGIDPMMALRYE
jgi:putative ABC transport system permease protein